jgi:hypothetical protein
MTQKLDERKTAELQAQIHQLSDALGRLKFDLPLGYFTARADLDAAIEALQDLVQHLHEG